MNMPLKAPAQDATKNLTTQVVDESKTRKQYGPVERSINSLKGIVYMTDDIPEGAGAEVDDADEDEDEDVVEEVQKPAVEKTTQESKKTEESEEPEFPWGDGDVDKDAAEKLVRNLRTNSSKKSRTIARIRASNDDLAEKLAASEAKIKEYETAEETKRVEGEKVTKKETFEKLLNDKEVHARVQALIFKLPMEEWEQEVKDAVKDFGKSGERGRRSMSSGHAGDLDMSPEAIRARRYNR